MASMVIEIKRKMDLTGNINYELFVDSVKIKEGIDLSDIESLAETIKDGFKRGEFSEKTIYSKNLNYP